MAMTRAKSKQITHKLDATGAATVNLHSKLSETVSVKDFGAVGDGVTDDWAAFQAALNTGKQVFVPYSQAEYKIGQPLEIREGSLIGEGYGYGGVGARFTILKFFNCTNPLRGAIYTLQANKKQQMPVIQDLYIQASSWDSVTGCLGYGLEIEAPIRADRVVVTGFKKSGVFFHNDATGNGPYQSIFTNVRSLTNGQHGFLVGAGANVVTLIQCEGKWNGAPSFNTAPTAAGSYDGIMVDNTSDGGSYFSFHPTSLTIIGGDCSYNSRYGLNVNDASGSNIQLGYAEYNLSSDGYQHCVGSQIRHNSINFGFVVSTQGYAVKIDNNSSVLATTNKILANGYDYGGGSDAGQTTVYDKTCSTNGGIRKRILYLGASDNGATNGTYIQADVNGNTYFIPLGTGNFQFTSGMQVGNSAVEDVNTLDYYQEGTFTPTIIGTATAGVGTYTTQLGEYTRIGNRVFFSISFIWTAHTGTGSLRVTGLPFAAKSTAGAFWPMATTYDSLTVGAGKELGAAVVAGSVNVSIYTLDPSGGAINLLPMDTAGSLWISGSYQAA